MTKIALPEQVNYAAKLYAQVNTVTNAQLALIKNDFRTKPFDELNEVINGLLAAKRGVTAHPPANPVDKIRRNRYAGKCTKCNGWIEAEAGELVKAGAKWGVNHIGECPAPVAPTVTTPAVELEDGVYRLDDTIFRVYHTVHGANVQVAKRLIVHEETPGEFTATWEYEGKKPLAKLTAEHHLTEDEAKVFGITYGFCVRCGRTLTQEESKHVGYGKTCAGHQGWWYPTKAELKKLTATSEPLAPVSND